MAGSIGRKPQHSALSDGAKSTGLISFAAAGSFSSAGTGIAWSNPSFALANDGNLSTNFNPTGTNPTQQLRAVNLAETGIPDSAIIVGVQVLFERFTPTTLGDYVDHTIQLVVAGSAAGNNLSDGSNWETAATNKRYGGKGNTWGLSLTGADVNGSGFGFIVVVQPAGTSKTAVIDYMAMRFWYR